MPSVCAVEKCNSPDLIREGSKISFFKAKGEVLALWQKVVPTKKEKILTKNHVVCELHFREDEIERAYKININESICELPKDRPTLKKGVVPSVFPYDYKEELVYSKIIEKKQLITEPSSKWSFLVKEEFIVWMNFIKDGISSDSRVLLYPDLKIRVFVNKNEVLDDTIEVKTIGDLNKLLEKVETFVPCGSFNSYRAENCAGFIEQKGNNERGPKLRVCCFCARHIRKTNRQKTTNDKLREVKNRVQKCSRKSKNNDRKCKRLVKKVQTLKEEITKIKQACSESKEEAIDEAVSKLPPAQQTAVKTCFHASKVNNSKNMRYTTNWVYECILLRIKSKKTYEHLRSREILKLPSVDTLYRYLRNLKTSYGFQPYIFEGMKMKSDAMPMEDRRGVILVDEMKLSTSLHFNQSDLKFEGFTDLGEWTPEHQKQKKGDHALVFMIQPFKGKWVQTLGCFLSVGSASGTVLHKLLLEGIALTEKSGFFVDAIVTDGASWNRSMWSMFGITEENSSVPHPICDERKLWFLSDFPHLIKALRNFLIKFLKYTIIYTPDGNISLKHWYALLDILEKLTYELRVNYKLRVDHVEPKYFQKMNVALAFQFFNIHDALEIYNERHEDLEDCEGTKRFCKRITSLIKAMNSRTAYNALAPKNQTWKIIEDFISYLHEWEKNAKEKKLEFMSDNCCYGLKVSLKAALEICSFLTEKCDFSYLMTARLNQDNLERFFSLMRDSCGANDHPDNALFISVYKLVSTYSLIKPPKGCNVEGPEIFQVLLNLKDVENSKQRKEQWEDALDNILDKGSSRTVSNDTILKEHDYSNAEASEYAISYVAGYVSRKGTRFIKFSDKRETATCNNCSSSLILGANDTIPERHKLIELKTRGSLQHPSVQLYNLISLLENAIITVIQEKDIQPDTLFQVTEKVYELSPIPFVGCDQHKDILTKRILSFYLTTRMLLISKRYNIIDDKERKLIQEKRKSAKLVGVSKTQKLEKYGGSAMDCCEDETKVAVKKKRVYKKKQKSYDQQNVADVKKKKSV